MNLITISEIFEQPKIIAHYNSFIIYFIKEGNSNIHIISFYIIIL